MNKQYGDIAETWRQEGAKYAAAVNEFVRIGMESNWEQKQKEPEDDSRYQIAGKVLEMIRAANECGNIEKLREELPPASWPLTRAFEDRLQSVEPIAFLEDGSVVFQIGHPGISAVYVADALSIEKVEEVYSAGVSPDGHDVALVDEKEIRVVHKPDRKLNGKVVASYEWKILQQKIKTILPEWQSLADEDHPETCLVKVIPFHEGRCLLLVSSAGTYIVDGQTVILVHPDPIEYEDDEDDDSDRYIGDAMVHGAVSPDNRWVAYGGQCSEHLLLDTREGDVYAFEPASSYPHYCSFSPDSQEVWFNACHFYNGATIKVDIASLEQGKASEQDDHPIMDEDMRVYGAASLSDGQILGDAYGYLRKINKNGQEIWRYFVGSTISGIAVSSDEGTLAVGTYGGMLHILDLRSESEDVYRIGTAAIKETNRWIVWKDSVPLRW